MLLISLLGVISCLLVHSAPTKAQAPSSPKRGLIYISTADSAGDSNVWTSESSDLTWYYNYGPTATPQLVGSKLEFVPMLFGKPSSGDALFNTTVMELIANGANISHVLSFNEPDGSSSTGGSSVDPQTAATLYKAQVEPLRAKGLKLGAPAVTSAQSGFDWLSSFFDACGGGCSVDFMPIHFYGDFQGLASYLGQFRATYPNATIWVTEYGFPNQGLNDTQNFFNQSSQYFDRLAYIERYSYFGSFRSSVSNVGPNEAMLNQNGQLTDIGSWYLGGSATGNIPSSAHTNFVRPLWNLILMAIIIYWLS